LFKALIQIEANGQLLLPDLRCVCCWLTLTHTYRCWRWMWKTDTMTELNVTVKQWIRCKQKKNKADKSG